MREVIPSLLWIGNAADARDLKKVLDHGIEALIDLAIEEPPISPTRELVCCRFPLLDGQGNSPALIEAAIRTAVILVSGKVPTLISCGGGMSRSPAIAAAVIAQLDGVKSDEAIKRIAATGPHDVSPLLWKEITRLTETMEDRKMSMPCPNGQVLRAGRDPVRPVGTGAACR